MSRQSSPRRQRMNPRYFPVQHPLDNNLYVDYEGAFSNPLVPLLSLTIPADYIRQLRIRFAMQSLYSITLDTSI